MKIILLVIYLINGAKLPQALFPFDASCPCMAEGSSYCGCFRPEKHLFFDTRTFLYYRGVKGNESVFATIWAWVRYFIFVWY